MCTQAHALRWRLVGLSTHLWQAYFTLPSSHITFWISCSWWCQSDTVAVTSFHRLSPTACISPVSPGERRSAISKAQQSCKSPEQGPQTWNIQSCEAKDHPKIHHWLHPTELCPTVTFIQHQCLPKCLQGCFRSLQWPVLPWSDWSAALHSYRDPVPLVSCHSKAIDTKFWIFYIIDSIENIVEKSSLTVNTNTQKNFRRVTTENKIHFCMQRVLGAASLSEVNNMGTQG